VISIVVILICLISGIGLVVAGIAIGEVANLWTSGLGVIPVVGVLFLAVSVGARYTWIDAHLPEASIALALFVAIEFLAGVVLAYIGLTNLISEGTRVDWILVGLFVFGVLLTVDSIVFYRKAFRQRK